MAEPSTDRLPLPTVRYRIRIPSIWQSIRVSALVCLLSLIYVATPTTMHF